MMNHAKDGVQVPVASPRESAKAIPSRRSKTGNAAVSAQGMGTKRFSSSRSGGMGYAGVSMAGSTR